jgi:hypothetical protein
MTSQELRDIAAFLNQLYDRLSEMKTPQIRLHWITNSPIILRPPKLRNDETQLLQTDQFTWIANNNNAATEFQARYCSLAGIKTIAQLQAHIPACRDGMELESTLVHAPKTPKINVHGKKGVAATTTVATPSSVIDMSLLKLRKPGGDDDASSSSSSSSSSSAPPNPYHRGVAEIGNRDQASDTPHIHGQSGLGTVTVETQLAFVKTNYIARPGDNHTNFHAEQRLLAALSMLRPALIENRSVTIIGTMPPCGTCAPHLQSAEIALDSWGASLLYDKRAGKGRGDAVDMSDDYFAVPQAARTAALPAVIAQVSASLATEGIPGLIQQLIQSYAFPPPRAD